jgi:hypothetical protein
MRPAQAVALGVEREDPADDGRFGLLDYPAHIALAIAPVLIAVDTATGHGAGLGPTTEGIVGALPGPAPLEAGGQGVEDRVDLARLVGQADRGIAEVGADLHAGLLDLEDGGRRPDRVAADARQLRNHEHVKRRARGERGEEGVEPGPVLPLGAAHGVIHEDVRGSTVQPFVAAYFVALSICRVVERASVLRSLSSVLLRA